MNRGTDKWRAFGVAMLAVHHRVAVTATCRCGRTVVTCEVIAQARQHGLLPPLSPSRPGGAGG